MYLRSHTVEFVTIFKTPYVPLVQLLRSLAIQLFNFLTAWPTDAPTVWLKTGSKFQSNVKFKNAWMCDIIFLGYYKYTEYEQGPL